MRTLRDFWERKNNADAEGPLRAWFAEVEEADWEGPDDVKARYAHASVLKAGRVVFNVRGNRYRIIVKIIYRSRTVYLRFVGTHSEYDEVDADTV